MRWKWKFFERKASPQRGEQRHQLVAELGEGGDFAGHDAFVDQRSDPGDEDPVALIGEPLPVLLR